jgi:hypothetical protein
MNGKQINRSHYIIIHQSPFRKSISGSPRLSTLRPAPGALLWRKATILELRFFIIYSRNFFYLYCWVFYSSFSLSWALTSVMPDLSGVMAGIGSLIALCIGMLSLGPDYGLMGIGSFFFMSIYALNFT